MHSKCTFPVFILALCSGLLRAQNPCDTVQVIAQATATNMTCDDPFATLTGALHPSAISYAWSGPAGFSSNKRIAQNFVKGTYVLTVTGALGCTAQTSVTVADLCTGYSLEPPECSAPYEQVVPAENCWSACVMPYLPTNVVYNTGNYGPDPAPNGWCGDIHNDQWFSFVAGATGGSITATPSNCTNGAGIQMALYAECGADLPIDCNPGGGFFGETPITLQLNNLIIGKAYFLVVDGWGGDVCDFTFSVPPGGLCTAQPPAHPPTQISGPNLVCPGSYAEYKLVNINLNNAAGYVWTAPAGSSINGLSAHELFYKPEGSTINVVFGQASGFVCARPVYYFYPPGAPICFSVNNMPIPPTVLPPVTVCNEDLPYDLPWGQSVVSSGTYQFTDQSYLGCDSIIKQKVTVRPPIIKNLPPMYLCAGNCFTINGTSYCESGSYSEVLTSYLGCDSLVNFQITVLDPVAEIQGGGVLSCAQNSLTLASASSPGSKIWKNALGQVLSSSNTLTVTQPGQYTLTVTQITAGVSCSQMDTILIEQNINPVQAMAQGGTLTCTAPNIQLLGSASDPQAVLGWFGPNGFTASGANPSVSLPGTYYLVATASNGCSTTVPAMVLADQTAPTINTLGGLLSCTQTSILLSATVSDPQAVLTWFGPNGDLLPLPIATAAGQYLVVATSANGCSATGSASVTAEQGVPIVLATGGTLTCINDSVQLGGGISDPQASFLWTGPGGFSSQDLHPTVILPGFYTLTASSINGCQGTAQALVNDQQQAPPLSLSADSVDCFALHPPQVYASPALPNLEYAWTGPHGFTATAAAPTISLPGLYTVVVVDPGTRCTNSASIEVPGELNLPSLAAVQLPPACGDSLLFLDAVSSSPDVQFQWTGPDNFISDLEDPVVSLPGWYQVTTGTSGGCLSTFFLPVVAAPALPQVSINSDTLGCLQSSVMLQVNSDQPPASYSWSGPAGFSSTEAGPTVTQPGFYQLLFMASNGCTATATTEVVMDSCITGLHDGLESSLAVLRLYPNASTGWVYVEAVGLDGLESLRIFAADGRLLLSQEYAAPKRLQGLDLTNWPAGVYPVSARVGGRWWTVRLVLIR